MGRVMRRSNTQRGTSRLSRDEEVKLVAQARDGCEQAARRLVEVHQDRLFAFVWRIVRDQHDAEEVCQDAFLRAFASLDSFLTEYRFSTWLFTIAYRLCLNSLRRKQMLSGQVEFAAFAHPAGDTTEEVANSEEARRLKKVIWAAVDDLTMPRRAVVLLFYREGQSCQEIGQVLDMPVATVKSHLHRARAKLRRQLDATLAGDWTRWRTAFRAG